MPEIGLEQDDGRSGQLRRLRSELEAAARLAGQTDTELVGDLIEMALSELESDLVAGHERSRTQA